MGSHRDRIRCGVHQSRDQREAQKKPTNAHRPIVLIRLLASVIVPFVRELVYKISVSLSDN